MYVKHMTTRSRKNTQFPIVLKTIINDAHRDNKTFTLNDKQIRSRLRARINAHVRNTSWIANNQREYDAIRCAFDATYATRIANASKRASRKNAKTSNAKTTNDANENA